MTVRGWIASGRADHARLELCLPLKGLSDTEQVYLTSRKQRTSNLLTMDLLLCFYCVQRRLCLFGLGWCFVLVGWLVFKISCNLEKSFINQNTAAFVLLPISLLRLHISPSFPIPLYFTHKRNVKQSIKVILCSAPDKYFLVLYLKGYIYKV